MRTIKYIGVFSALFFVLTLTGYDCPEINFKAQITATLISLSVAVICGLIWAKNEQ